MNAQSSIEQRSSFDFIRYANCWEDASVLVKALDTGPGKAYLSICSAGDNSLALLTLNPALVVAVDLSRVQLACLELRKAAIERFEYETAQWFLGFSPICPLPAPATRLEMYDQLRSRCSKETCLFWDQQQSSIESGIIFHGKFERYFGLFRTWVLPLVHGKKTIAQLLADKDRGAREQFYLTQWNTWRWQLMFRVFFGRFVMGRAGRDPEFFRYVKGSVADRILQRARHALTVLPTHNNPYLRFILTGSFGSALPFYMRRENHAIIKKNIGRLQLCHGTTDDAFALCRQGFDGFNLSDIFEYMDETHFAQTAEGIINHGIPGARMVSWNMLVPRSMSLLFPHRVRLLENLSAELFSQDQAFFYQALLVDEVL